MIYVKSLMAGAGAVVLLLIVRVVAFVSFVILPQARAENMTLGRDARAGVPERIFWAAALVVFVAGFCWQLRQ